MNIEDTWPLRYKIEGLIISLRSFLDLELKSDKPVDNKDRLALLDVCDWIESDLGISSGPLPME